MHQVLSVVQLGLCQNNGPWVFPVPGNLEIFIQVDTSEVRTRTLTEANGLFKLEKNKLFWKTCNL